MNKKRKIIALLLCVCLLFVCTPAAGAEEVQSVLEVGQSCGRRGETVTVYVSLNAVNGIAGGSFSIAYSDMLTLESAAAGEMLSGRTCTINTKYAANTVRVSFAGMSELSGDGALLRLDFRISRDAPIGELPVTAKDVKLMDISANVVTRAAKSGSVTVGGAGLSLSSDRCLSGQAVKLDLSLFGELYPAGGAFDIKYNDRMLTAASVNAEEKLGNVGVSLSYNIDAENGVIHVSWAAAYTVDALGRLGTVIFAVSPSARGDTAVTLENIRLYDEASARLDCHTPVNGTVTVVDSYNEQPTLYVVGGQLSEDGQSATIRIAVDGSGEVFGGRFDVSYDTEKCTLTDMRRVMACVAVNPENVSNAECILTATWAEDSPSLDNETVLELTFSLAGSTAAELVISNAVLFDGTGSAIENIQVHSGKIGISSAIQAPIAELVNTEHSVGVSAVLYDAGFCSEAPTVSTTVFAAAYQDGKMTFVELPQEAVVFDSDGIAKVQIDMDIESEMDTVKLFAFDANGTMSPMCEQATLEVAV